MKLGKLSKWPNPKKLRYLLIFSLIILVIVYPIMIIFFILSGYPVDFFSSQLSFNGQLLKVHYQVTNIDLYRVFQILDFGFMISYGSLIFYFALSICRKFDTDSIWRKMGYIVALLGIISACCDAIENIFILAMLIDPVGFPDIWAIVHSIFALIKYILLLSSILWIIIGYITSKLKK
ncbi:MAG: hypothetical protein ACFFBP_08415 [Promethearchaeota archaeon]